MNAFRLAIASIRSRLLVSSLSIIAAAAGVALLSAVFLLSGAVDESLNRNSRGIDLVVGAKGSPVQLILSSVYHSDVPNGNIKMKDFERLSKNPQVRLIIPLAMGDNYRGWRVVGTTKDYLSHYNAVFAEGQGFSKPFEVVAGSLTGLKIGDEFAATHGFAVDTGDVHDAHLYKVVGVLKRSGTVLDRLITTPIESVQDLHSHAGHDHDHHHDHDHEESDADHQITAALVKVKSPAAVMSLPRQINASTNMLAANPHYEMARLSQNLGIGRDVLTALGIGIVGLSVLMLFAILASNLSARRYDLAVLRVLGASPQMLFATIIAEATILSGSGALLGLLAGHLAASGIVVSIPGLNGMIPPQAILVPDMLDLLLFTGGLAAGLIASIVPAISASRTDIALLLAKGKI